MHLYLPYSICVRVVKFGCTCIYLNLYVLGWFRVHICSVLKEVSFLLTDIIAANIFDV
jgi:hypothetical protein